MIYSILGNSKKITKRISTVFLAFNHNFDEGPPLLFKTMIFGGKYDQEQWRYTTWEEAEKGHQLAVNKVKGEKWISNYI